MLKALSVASSTRVRFVSYESRTQSISVVGMEASEQSHLLAIEPAFRLILTFQPARLLP